MEPVPPAPTVVALPDAPLVVLPVEPPAPAVVVPPSLVVFLGGVASLALHPAIVIARKLEAVKPRSAMCRVFMLLWPF